MTTQVQARDVIVSFFNPLWLSTFPGVKLFYENTLQVDLDQVGDSFLTVYIDFTDSVRQSVDSIPITKSWGEIIFRVFAKEGKGIRATMAMQDYIISVAQYQKLSGVETECARPGRKVSKSGWTSSDLRVPFFYYQ